MQAFDATQTQVLARAFDRAWEIILRESAGDPPDVESTRRLLAKRILRLAKAGHIDERRLACAALMYLRTQQLSQATSRGAAQGPAGGSPMRRVLP